jgi:hypothetical protein
LTQQVRTPSQAQLIRRGEVVLLAQGYRSFARASTLRLMFWRIWPAYSAAADDTWRD